jgi:hypothetical protein
MPQWTAATVPRLRRKDAWFRREECVMQTAIINLLCAAGIALSAKSIVVLSRASPWTSAGWGLTIIYFIEVIVKASLFAGLAAYAEYAVLGALAVAFVIAGVRDEPQAEPWWWPSRLGVTRAETRRT